MEVGWASQIQIKILKEAGPVKTKGGTQGEVRPCHRSTGRSLANNPHERHKENSERCAEKAHRASRHKQ
jgi:hypothetical protein